MDKGTTPPKKPGCKKERKVSERTSPLWPPHEGETGQVEAWFLGRMSVGPMEQVANLSNGPAKDVRESWSGAVAFEPGPSFFVINKIERLIAFLAMIGSHGT